MNSFSFCQEYNGNSPRVEHTVGAIQVGSEEGMSIVEVECQLVREIGKSSLPKGFY